jgi:uncharacterized protein with HEPN domain
MSKRDITLLLTDILESAQKIIKYTDGLSFQDFLADSKTIDAVVRNFEIIGEAANRLAEDFKDEQGHIGWKRLRGFRNRIIHDYFGLDYQIVWLLKRISFPI